MESEVYTAMEHRDLQANTMAINNTGSYILLAGRRYIAIRNLDDLDNDNMRKFPMNSKYDVGSAEWNPTDHNSQLSVISTNQRLEVFTWSLGQLTLLNSLKAHTRVITDLNWNRSDPNLLASCSVDTFIHIWDLRDPRRPASSLSAIAEASQVRWNPISHHVVATAHDGDVKLWDMRRGSAPTQYIAAHLAKIHGLDWNPSNERQLATCSQDNTIKFFDVENPRRAECVLTTNAPVWRARFTPFGNGLVTVVVPQLRRGENSLLLWNTTPEYSGAPVHTFTGHKDVVLEFAWRQQRHLTSNGRRSKHQTKRCKTGDYELVTWSKDQRLLVWRADSNILQLCDYSAENNSIDDEFDFSAEDSDDLVDVSNHGDDIGIDIVDRVDKTTGYIDIPSNGRVIINSIYDDADAVDRSRTVNVTLQQEFSLLNAHIGQLQVLQMDISQRLCVVRVVSTRYLVTLQITFPLTYPLGAPPTFTLIQDKSSIDDSAANHLIQTLTQVAQLRVLKNRTCLEPCLRQMVTTLDQLSSNLHPSISSPDHSSLLLSTSNQHQQQQLQQSKPGSYNNLSFLLAQKHLMHDDVDMFVPCPRMSGARWGGVDGLVCFGFGAQALGGRRAVGQQQQGGRKNGVAATTVVRLHLDEGGGMPRSYAEWKELCARREGAHQWGGSSNGAGVGRRDRTRSGNYTTNTSTSSSTHHSAFNRSKSTHNAYATATITHKRSTITLTATPTTIHIYDTSPLFLANRTIAAAYRLLVDHRHSDISAICRWNGDVARRELRYDLAQSWRLVELVVASGVRGSGAGVSASGGVCSDSDSWVGGAVEEAAEVGGSSAWDEESGGCVWAAGRHPFGGALIDSLISHYAAQNDIQTAAILSCISNKIHDQMPRKPVNDLLQTSPTQSSYHTIPPADIVAEGWVIPSLLNRSTRSCSLDNLRNGVQQVESAVATLPANMDVGDRNGGGNAALYEYYKCAYADTLLRWGLLYNRAEVLKYSTRAIPTPHTGLHFTTDCHHCSSRPSSLSNSTLSPTFGGAPSPSSTCAHCCRPSLLCVICHISVRGAANCCVYCGHGGHARHLSQWFERHDVCPTGCGCRCLTMSEG